MSTTLEGRRHSLLALPACQTPKLLIYVFKKQASTVSGMKFYELDDVPLLHQSTERTNRAKEQLFETTKQRFYNDHQVTNFVCLSQIIGRSCVPHFEF